MPSIAPDLVPLPRRRPGAGDGTLTAGLVVQQFVTRSPAARYAVLFWGFGGCRRRPFYLFCSASLQFVCTHDRDPNFNAGPGSGFQMARAGQRSHDCDGSRDREERDVTTPRFLLCKCSSLLDLVRRPDPYHLSLDSLVGFYSRGGSDAVHSRFLKRPSILLPRSILLAGPTNASDLCLRPDFCAGGHWLFSVNRSRSTCPPGQVGNSQTATRGASSTSATPSGATEVNASIIAQVSHPP